MGKLNSIFVQRAQKPGLYGDGNGVYLQVSKGGCKSWIFRFMLNNKSRAMGMGSIELVSLSEARLKAFECRKLLLDGVDPIESKRSLRNAQSLLDAKTLSFEQCAKSYIDSHKPSWKNAKHADQWANTLRTYANPIIGHLAIQDVNTALVMKVLEPIWYSKTETASRVRNRMELILSWATVRGFRVGDNPARWRGHLDKLLPRRTSIQKVKHFSAIPIEELSVFMEKLRGLQTIVARGLEFQILTACRTNEAMGARWSEINLQEGLWTIPASRMKAEREHRIPISERGLEILQAIKRTSNSAFVFPGKNGGPLSSNAFLALIKKTLKYKLTAHGFRSTFSDWAAEKTGHSRETIEMALAHSVRDSTEAAYRRGDLLLKRRLLMTDWAKFCNSPTLESCKVIKILDAAKTID